MVVVDSLHTYLGSGSDLGSASESGSVVQTFVRIRTTLVSISLIIFSLQKLYIITAFKFYKNPFPPSPPQTLLNSLSPLFLSLTFFSVSPISIFKLAFENQDTVREIKPKNRRIMVINYFKTSKKINYYKNSLNLAHSYLSFIVFELTRKNQSHFFFLNFLRMLCFYVFFVFLRYGSDSKFDFFCEGCWRT